MLFVSTYISNNKLYMCNIYLGGKKKNRDAVRNLFLFFGRQNSLLNFVDGVVEW